jgi:hypothetical protein
MRAADRPRAQSAPWANMASQVSTEGQGDSHESNGTQRNRLCSAPLREAAKRLNLRA